MRLTLDAGWLHLDLCFGPDEQAEEAEPEYAPQPLDAMVERTGNERDYAAEMDGRPLGFRGSR